MTLARPKNTSRYSWSRHRISITLLSWSGCRASEIASLTLKQINQAILDQAFTIVKPKTGNTRHIILPEQAVDALKALKLDFAVVFEGNKEKPLASGLVSTELLSSVQWLASLNYFIRLAQVKFNLVLTSHSFRAHYIICLLRAVPLQGATKLIAHSSTNTTAHYDRYFVNATLVRSTLGELL